ncbi:adenylate/guanylate cyclase domain-containing protein [Nocardioides panacisoli]|uniref:adenylate/guanylate cyclase domain-containing protein n=1 Tax=Nocardioides panacisoli TaxID=627624 RepID=UPI001C62E1EC|nr:adenylate/guanylate cyclase domain-containing protein [Nocardioides panacisoli]QYJ03482.1 adenylate/guanylate cyclase domain-containing protein [Nocardioides panacisoli]
MTDDEGPDAPAGAERPPAEALLPDDALEQLEPILLGGRPELTRREVSERSGVPLPFAQQLWRLMGFAEVGDDVPAFTEADVRSLQLTRQLIDSGILNPTRQDGLVRTWGRSFARLAEWQAELLADIALESEEPMTTLFELAEDVVPMIDELQAYTWRRHVHAVASRMLTVTEAGADPSKQAVCFVDIAHYTRQSRTLSEEELVAWLEGFESAVLDVVVRHGGRIIKNIGDELLITCDSPTAAAEIALEMVARGADDGDDFPDVHAGVAYGDVVTRLGDVYGPVVNIASRLTSAARPNSVLVDRGMYEAVTGRPDHDHGGAGDDHGGEGAAYRLRRIPRLRVKGYSRLHVWRLLPRN